MSGSGPVSERRSVTREDLAAALVRNGTHVEFDRQAATMLSDAIFDALLGVPAMTETVDAARQRLMTDIHKPTAEAKTERDWAFRQHCVTDREPWPCRERLLADIATIRAESDERVAALRERGQGMTTPRTAAGRAHVAHTVGMDVLDEVLAIEAEARAAALEPVFDALTSEDEIAHGEAMVEREGDLEPLGVCAYCDGEWPCRTQQGIDRLIAAIDALRERSGE